MADTVYIITFIEGRNFKGSYVFKDLDDLIDAASFYLSDSSFIEDTGEGPIEKFMKNMINSYDFLSDEGTLMFDFRKSTRNKLKIIVDQQLV